MELPGTGLVRAYNVGADANPNAAAAPWAALGALGGQIQNIGEHGMGILVRAKQADTRRRASEMELELQQTGSEYQLEMLKNPNASPEDIMGGLQQRLDAVRGKYITANMSPDEQDVIGQRYAQAAAGMTQSTAKHALVGSINNSKQAAMNLVKAAELSGNVAQRDQGLSDLAAILPEADIEAERMESNRRMASSRVVLDIQADPQAWKDRLAGENGLADYPGLGPGDIPRLREIAKSAANEQTRESIDEYRDKLATDDITTPEDIDRMFGGRVRPSIIEGMKGELAKRYDEGLKALRKSPAYQAELGGAATGLVSGAASAEDFEDGYAEASFAVDQMEDSPLKRRLDKRLKDTRAGREADIKTHADAAFKALDSYDTRELDKIPKPSKVTTLSVVRDGFFKNVEKQKRLGFSTKQAEELKKLAEKDPAAAQKYFNDNWKGREIGSVRASPAEIDAADAIKNGNAFVPWNSPEEEDAYISKKMQHERQVGERHSKLAEWLEVNTDASRDQIDGKVLEIAGEQAQRELKSGIFDRATSGGPKGADDSTAAVPVGNDLSAIVKNFEAGGAPGGFHKEAYWDYGQWSIGYGTRAKKGEVIDQKEAEKRLASELSSARSEVDTISKSVGLSFNDHEKDALTSFAYNLGGGRLKQLFADGGRSKEQIADMMLLYRNAGGQRLAGLEKRRKAERHLFIHGYSKS